MRLEVILLNYILELSNISLSSLWSAVLGDFFVPHPIEKHSNFPVRSPSIVPWGIPKTC